MNTYLQGCPFDQYFLTLACRMHPAVEQILSGAAPGGIFEQKRFAELLELVLRHFVEVKKTTSVEFNPSLVVYPEALSKELLALKSQSLLFLPHGQPKGRWLDVYESLANHICDQRRVGKGYEIQRLVGLITADGELTNYVTILLSVLAHFRHMSKYIGPITV